MRRPTQRVLLLLTTCLTLALTSSGAPPGGGNASANFFSMVVDEQTNVGCPNPPLIAPPLLYGDTTSGPTTIYNTPPWSVPTTSVTSSAYANGADCSPTKGTCTSVSLSKSTLSIDTRLSQDAATGQPRNLKLDFSQPCPGCPYGPGPANPFGAGPLATPGLLSIFLTTPFNGMAICSTTDCPESETGTARFWFDDPTVRNLQWRVDWGFVRVLRVSANTWYVLADACDGSQVATLYRLNNNKKNVTVSRQGQYMMPFFASGVQN